MVCICVRNLALSPPAPRPLSSRCKSHQNSTIGSSSTCGSGTAASSPATGCRAAASATVSPATPAMMTPLATGTRQRQAEQAEQKGEAEAACCDAWPRSWASGGASGRPRARRLGRTTSATTAHSLRSAARGACCWACRRRRRRGRRCQSSGGGRHRCSCVRRSSPSMGKRSGRRSSRSSHISRMCSRPRRGEAFSQQQTRRQSGGVPSASPPSTPSTHRFCSTHTGHLLCCNHPPARELWHGSNFNSVQSLCVATELILHLDQLRLPVPVDCLGQSTRCALIWQRVHTQQIWRAARLCPIVMEAPSSPR